MALAEHAPPRWEDRREGGSDAFGAYARAHADQDSAWSAWCRTVDHGTLFACVLLFAAGVVLAFAASPTLALRNELPAFYYAWRQLLFGLPAFALLIVLSFLNASWVRTVGVVAFAIGIAAMAALPMVGVSHGKEATRWLSVGGLSLQPTEILKPGLVVVSALFFSTLQSGDRAMATLGTVAALLCLLASVALLSIQPDFGQAALLIMVWSALYFAAGGALRLLTVVGLLVLIGGWVAYENAAHFAARIDNFLDPSGAAQGQLQAAEAAIINGGWFGTGLGEGVEKKYLPDAHADFILAVAAEEFGFGMVAFIICMFTGLVLRAVTRLWREEDAFIRLAGLGLALLIGLQAAVNIAVSAKIAPITGMTLPFISYGGTSLLASAATMGLLLALTRWRSDGFRRFADETR
ncbi:MAG: FtsW/RodA/SpoVE family cell cycle protein [Pseudomonadota bacterium]